MRHKLSYLIMVTMVAAMALIAGCSSDELAGPGGDQAPAFAKIWIEGPLAMPAATSGQFKAFILEQDGTRREITTEAAWAISDPAAASVDRGFVTTKVAGRYDIQLTYRGVTFVDPLLIARDRRGTGTITNVRLEGYDPLKQVVQFSPGETRQLKATVRLPGGEIIDVTDRLTWKNGNPAAISVTEMGMAEVRVAQGASELFVTWRGQFGIFKLQVGAPLPKEYDVFVDAVRITALYSCDSATNKDGGDGEFSYEINIITPTGQRLMASGTNNYPDENEVVLVDQGDFTAINGTASILLSDIQSLEVEVRVTEWDLQWTDFGKPIPDSDMDNLSVTRIYRGAEGFSPGKKSVVLTGTSGDCEVEIEYNIRAWLK